MNYFLGIFFSLFIISASADNTFDPVLQSYRSNYLTLKGSSYSTLDKSFFDVYNLLKSKISEVRDTYSIYSVIMNKTCTGFQYNTTRSSTGSRLMSFCGTLNTIMEYTDQELDDLITTFYYGTLGGDTEPLKIADYMWQSGDDNLNSLPFLFNKSPNCMSSYLGNYLQIFRRNINTIVSKSTIVTRNITNRFSDMTIQTGNIGDFIKNMSNELNNCNKLNDSTKCVREFLVKFSNCDEKSTCASEKLQETIKNCTSLVNEIRIAYHENMMDAKDQIGLIDDDLDTLADSVMKCATKTTARAVTTTARSVRNAITTTAARGITTARTRPSSATTTTTTRKPTTSTIRATSTKSTLRPSSWY